MFPARRRLLALIALLPTVARTHNGQVGRIPPQDEAPKSVKIALPDTPLVDQDGRKVRLRSDVMAGRVVVVDFIYTTCTTICPIFTATMVNVQERLGDAVGRDVHLVSVTVDPLRDTPRRLKEYAGKRAANLTGWSFLTGNKPDVDAVNRAFGTYTPNSNDHPPMVLVGDTGSGQWTRFFGFPAAGDLETRVRQLLAARKSGS